jgi:hypothetical protein
MPLVVPELVLLAMAIGAIAVVVATLVERPPAQVTIYPASPGSPDEYSLALRRGATLVVRNNDLLAHRLVQVEGPPVELGVERLERMGATCDIHFSERGTYVFRTTTGAGYVPWLDPHARRITLKVTV